MTFIFQVTSCYISCMFPLITYSVHMSSSAILIVLLITSSYYACMVLYTYKEECMYPSL